MIRHHSRPVGAILAALLLLAGAPSAWGQSTWTNTAGGLWNTAANWSPGVPLVADNAQFSTVTGSYTVTFNVSPTTNGLSVSDGNVVSSQVR